MQKYIWYVFLVFGLMTSCSLEAQHWPEKILLSRNFFFIKNSLYNKNGLMRGKSIADMVKEHRIKKISYEMKSKTYSDGYKGCYIYDKTGDLSCLWETDYYDANTPEDSLH